MGAFTTYTVLEVAFAELALRKLSCEVLAFNTAALSMYERFGFVREGVFREQILKPEGPVDVLRLGILAREWEATRDAHRDRLRARSILTT
jgi:RimJ/RimL family protein N-acetyltransferase